MMDGSSRLWRFQQRPRYGTPMPGAGAVHPIIPFFTVRGLAHVIPVING
jgi:hypothetical protein